MFDRDAENRRNQSIGLAIILAIIVFFWGNIFLRTAANMISFVTAPFVYTNKQIADNARLSLMLARPKEDLAEENLLLRARLNYLESKNFLPVGTEDRPTNNRDRIIKARILSRPNLFPYDYLLVDLGDKNTSSAVKPGQIVSYGNVALGRVVTVYQTVSKVRLFSTGGTQLSVSIGSTSPSALAQGISGGNFVITMPRAINIAAGSLVTAPSLPRGLVLGRVGFIDKSPAIPFQKVYFRYPLNLYEITSVDIHRD